MGEQNQPQQTQATTATPPADPPAAPQPGSPPATPERTFTQAEVTAMMTAEKKQGRDAAIREVSEQLGVGLEEAKELVARARAQEEAEKSDAQKAQEAADKRERAAADREAAAKALEHQLRTERALILKGVHPEKAPRAARLVDAPHDADDEALDAAIEVVRGELPELFAAPGTPPATPPRAPRSDPPGSAPAPSQTDDAMRRGYEKGKQAAGAGRTSYAFDNAAT